MPRLDGTQLRIHRTSRGWTQSDLADQLRTRGVKASAIRVGAWESEREEPWQTALWALADVFGVEPETLVKKRR